MQLKSISLLSTLTLACALPLSALAQTAADNPPRDDERVTDPNDPNSGDRTIGAGEPSGSLPPPRSDNDPRPPVAAPVVPNGGVVHQAGIGGPTAYGRGGVLELGGSATFTSASGFTQLNLNPSLGWFFMDNVEISGILGLSHLSAQGVDATFVSAVLEPSIHIPFTDALFGFAGAGLGLSWIDGPGLGFAFAPRAGLNILVGRSGILTPQFTLNYSTHEAIVTPTGTLLAVSLAIGAGIGYTVMW